MVESGSEGGVREEGGCQKGSCRVARDGTGGEGVKGFVIVGYKGGKT